jgi:hypothetical protein
LENLVAEASEKALEGMLNLKKAREENRKKVDKLNFS